MCYFAHAVTSHVASAPRLAEDVAAFVPVSLPARARKALLASDQSQIDRTPLFLASLCSALAQAVLKVHIGGKNDQIDRCCFCLDLGNIRAGHVARAASSVGRHDHASPPCMRCRLSHGQWHLHSYCRPPERRQVCGWDAFSGWSLR